MSRSIAAWILVTLAPLCLFAQRPFDGLEMTKPLSPEESLKAMHVRPGMKIELVAAEPLVVDPVAIDWGPDGKLWVVEMRDYPTGMNENGTPGGRVKYLEDTDGDGRYDRAQVFLDGLLYPTGVMHWGKGVLVCAAPDVIYAEDTDGDGRADVKRVILTGFSTSNPQHLVNGLMLGLDGWVYGATVSGPGTIQVVGLASSQSDRQDAGPT